MSALTMVAEARGTIARIWWWLRQVSGDAAYQNYLRSAVRRNAGERCEPLLSPEEFYLDQLRRKYARATRCC